MSLYGVKQVPCTLCRTSFPLVSGAMNHPADVLCDACILSLYDRAKTEPADVLRAWCEERLQPRMGMGPDILASGIIDRVGRLDELVQSRVELENMLVRRGVLGG